VEVSVHLLIHNFFPVLATITLILHLHYGLVSLQRLLHLLSVALCSVGSHWQLDISSPVTFGLLAYILIDVDFFPSAQN
jgi:hypothetical protein